MKFEINEKVWIKPLNREGIVVSYNIVFHKDMPRSTTSYEVMYGSEYYHSLEQECLGKRPAYVYAQESDLEFYKDPIIVSIQDELSTKIKNMMDKVLKELDKHTHHLDIPGYPTTPPKLYYPDNYHYKVTSVHTRSCEHKWQTYDSGWSKYDFCSKCDEKR